MLGKLQTFSAVICVARISNLYKVLVTALTFVLLNLVGTAAMASVPALSGEHQLAIAEQSDMGGIGYCQKWMDSLRRQATKAIEDDAPYLAVRLWQQLAQAGDSNAAFRLGLYYDTAQDHPRDPNLAVRWYRQAAMAGEIHAQHNLAVAYAKGDGVTLDITQAIKWWTLAARHGNADSQYNLGIMYAAGEYGIKRDFDQARRWWRKAAMHGDPMAQYNLGTLYVNNGIHDYCEATRWWKEAARNGVQRASLALRMIETRADYHSCQ